MKQNDINSGTSTKGYMAGFAVVVANIRLKQKKEVFIRDKISAAIVVDYTQQICAQIEAGLIGVMKRTQQPILNFMSLFGIAELSKNIGIQLNQF